MPLVVLWTSRLQTERVTPMIVMITLGNHRANIPGAMVQSLGLAQQWTVDPEGARVNKFRLTQDLSVSMERGAIPTFINSSIDMSAYVEIIYGWSLPWIVHHVVLLRAQNPTMLKVISKYKHSVTYRRIAQSARAATQTIVINGALAYLSLRLMFRVSEPPNLMHVP
jgi:hypothetical protein